MNECVGAIDGFFVRTLMTRKKDCVNNQMAYFTGHYEHYGVNCLGICDVKGRYLFFCRITRKNISRTVVFRRWMSRNFERYASRYILCRWCSI